MAKRINQDRSEGLSNDLDELIMADVRGHLRNYGDWRKLAQATGVSYSTIENYAYGWTQRPQQHTTTRLMEGMGLGDKLRKAYRSDFPVGREEALSARPAKLRKAHAKRKKDVAKRSKAVSKALKAFQKQN